MVIEVGKLAGNAIVPYSQTTKQTKTVDTVSITSGTGLSNIINYVSKSDFKADSNGVWRLNFNARFRADIATGSSFTFTIDDVVFSDTANYKGMGFISIEDGDYATNHIWSELSGVNTVTVYLSASVTGETGRDISINFSNIYLKSEPTTYTTAANMEASTQADIYVEPASATQSGLVNLENQSMGSGEKYFDDKVGIGTTSPVGNKVHIQDGVSSAATYPFAELIVESSNATANGIQIKSPTNGSGRVSFGDPVGSSVGQIAYAHSSDNMSFITNGVNRMTIDNSGNVGIGGNPVSGTPLTTYADSATSYAVSFINDGNNTNRIGPVIRCGEDVPSGTNTFMQFLDGDGSDAGTIKRVGTGTCAFVAACDRRIKTNIENASPILDKLLQVVIKEYEIKGNPYRTKGPIAQDLVKLFPKFVNITDDGLGEELPEGVKPWNVQKDWDYELIQAIQEQQALIDEKDARISQLESQITDILSRIEVLER